jgi:DNA-binding NarL/FixJ family response regulator
MELLTQKNRVVLAMQAMKIDTYLSQWPAVAICNVLQSTLSRQLARTTSRRDFRANSSRLTKHEEDTLVLYIKKLDARGFAPTLGNVRDIVNRLHAVRGGSQVSKNGLATSSVASLSSNLNTLDGAITRESYTVILRSLAPSSTLHRIQRGSTVS